MEAFTDIDSGIIPTAAAMTSSAKPTTTPASVPNKNAAYTATNTTPLSSPKKHGSPSTPDQTPLRQRFLRAVSMSPAIPSRPSMEGRKTSEKARDSPIVVRHTPKKTNQPPMKLEVGQGAFYFSIELPPSKITSKRSGTTSKSGTPKGEETPTRTRTPSPLKNASPTKEDAAGTPTRTTRNPLKRRETIHQSPARPLFGTPTKMTPKQNPDPQTPTRRTPSPQKTYSSVNQSPARIAVGTPRRKVLGDTPGSNRPGSPVKRSIEEDDSPTNPIKTSSLLTNKVQTNPKETSRKPIGGLTSVDDVHVPNPNLIATAFTSPPPPHPESTEQAPTPKASPENIGQLMASLICDNTSTHDWTSSHHDNEIASPIPTPLRRAGEKLKLGESPSFLRMSPNGTTTVTSDDPAADIIRKGSLFRHEPASTEPQEDRSKSIERLSPRLPEEASSSSITEDQVARLDHTGTTPQELQSAFPLRQADPGSSSAINAMRRSPAPPRRSLSYSEQRSETHQKESSQQEYQARGHGIDNSLPKSFLPVPASHQRRVGTDPSVLLKTQKDTVNLEATMCRSAGVVDTDFCGPLHLNELSDMPKSLFVRDQQDIGSPGAEGTPETLSRADSGTSSLQAVQADGEKGIERPTATRRVSSAPRIPRWKPVGATPALAKDDCVAAAKRKDSQSKGADKTVAAGRARPRAGSAVSRPTKSGTVASTARRKTLATPVKPTLPVEATSHSSPHSRIPSLTSTNTKSPIPPVPKIPRKPLPGTSGPGKAVATLKERLPNVPSVPINPRPVPTRKPLRPSAIEPYNPSADPRPYEQKFASAGDIADRLAGWHNENRKKAEADRAKVPTRPVNKTPARTPLRAQPIDSTTPDGSPDKNLILLMETPASTEPLSPTKDAKSRPFSTKPPPPTTPKAKTRAPAPAPKTPIPKTPALGARKAAVNDLRQPIMAGAPKTPVNRRMTVLDRNATRTPSKDIVSSLDAAIDRKIAEDARRGLEFTPGGNRLRDLLNARDGYLIE